MEAIVKSFAPGVRVIPLPAVIPFTASVGPVPSVTRLWVPPALVNVTDDAGDELVTVKLGYTPVTEIPVPLEMATVWSGDALVTVMSFAPDVRVIPVPAVIPFTASVGPTPSATRLCVPPADVNVVVVAGSVFVIVKDG